MKKILITLLFAAAFSATQATLADVELKTSSTTQHFDVINIKQGNSLKIYTWPSLTSKVVVAMPHNAQTITYKGSTVKQGETIWKKIYWNNNEGWVNAKYLRQTTNKTTTIVKQQKQSTSPASQISTHPPQTIITQQSSPSTSQTTTQTPQKPSAKVNSTNPQQKQTLLACGGSTPFWDIHMDLTDKTILVNLQDGKSFSTSLESRKWDTDKNEMIILGGKDTQSIKAVLNKTNTCTDGLTTLKYPFTVNITLGANKKISGCCRTIQK